MAMQRQMPLLGICRGHQIINVACGGDNYQDIAKQHQGAVLKHSQDEPRNVASHLVSVKKGTLLANIIGECDLPTNSFHHQGVSVVAPGFIGSAETSDGVNEAIEKPSYPVMGVQWHPEAMASVGDERMLSLFRWLVEGSAVYRRAREFHRRELTLDSHCDTPMFFPERVNIGVRDLRLKVDIPKLIDGRIDAECMVAYLPQRGRSDAELAAATEKCNSILEELRCQIALNSSRVIQVRNEKEILAAKRAGKKGIFFGIENGYAIGRDISALKHYRDEGIIYMTLCHNGDNDICDSAKGEREHGGLSEFGRYVVKEMNEIGMMVDISHASDESFYDALKLSTAPIIASHSSCRALCGHRRNLTDEQIKALADCGGVVQICIYEDFLSDDGLATVKTVADHINHVVELVGVDYVGIGSDLDGGGGVPGCNAVNELINITCELIRRGYGDGDLKKIWGGNFLRVMGV
ncbi:MAG: membrane dipeptidase, partial [Bacteroidales bacterium]